VLCDRHSVTASHSDSTVLLMQGWHAVLSVGDGFDGFCWVIVLVETTQADGFFHLAPGESGYDLAGNSTEGSIVTIAALFPILYTKAIHSYYILFGPPTRECPQSLVP
jgi:hypothetical protein